MFMSTLFNKQKKKSLIPGLLDMLFKPLAQEYGLDKSVLLLVPDM
jgi:hypothetical protein